MDQERPTDPGWAGEVEQLMLHGRDGEAAELAARHLRGDRLRAATPTRGGNAMGPLEQIDEGFETAALRPEGFCKGVVRCGS